MNSFFSKKCEYGLQAVLYLAALDTEYICSSEEISSKLLLPREFTSKILQSLTESKIIESRKGKSGGFKLAKKANELKLIDVVIAIDGDEIFKNCVMGFANCTKDKKCMLHDEWQGILNNAIDMLSRDTLDSFKNKMIDQLQ
jgi:Rrf2 family transcriptional regulator, iron-sulfur cluster assembly transcription factor